MYLAGITHILIMDADCHALTCQLRCLINSLQSHSWADPTRTVFAGKVEIGAFRT
jgi:hypothetical protein